MEFFSEIFVEVGLGGDPLCCELHVRCSWGCAPCHRAGSGGPEDFFKRLGGLLLETEDTSPVYDGEAAGKRVAWIASTAFCKSLLRTRK
jgi:hypothetical protein